MSRSLRFALGALVALRILTAEAPARAHEPPKGIGLVFADDAPGALPLIVTNRGLVFAEQRAEGVRYSLRCNESYEANTSDHPWVGYDSSGALVLGVYYRVYRTLDRACGTQAATGLGDDPLSNLVRDPTNPDRLWVATRTYKTPSKIMRSEDGGRSFSTRYQHPLGSFFDGLLSAPSDALRLYGAGVTFDQAQMQVSYQCLRSDDGGQSWLSQSLPGKIIPFAVHPKNAEIVFAYEATDKLETQYRVLRSTDGGAHFRSVLENVVKPTALAGSQNQLWLGIGLSVDDTGGLYRSSDDGEHFEHVHTDLVQSVSCLVQRGARLWLCANLAPNQNGIWFSDDEGSSISKWMSFEQIEQPVVCEQNQAVCAGAWYDFDSELHPASADAGVAADASTAPSEAGAASDEDPDTQDAATPEAEVDAGTAHPRAHSGCQLTAAPEYSSAWMSLLGLSVWFTAQRRARSRKRPGRGVRAHALRPSMQLGLKLNFYGCGPRVQVDGTCGMPLLMASQELTHSSPPDVGAQGE